MSSENAVQVLVVDDNYAQRLSIRAVLADLDVEIVEATSGREALRLLLRDEFAVILLDVNMPGLDGLETAALIRARPSCEKTPIILVTAYSDEGYATRGYSLGVVDYIMTPVQPEVLRTKVSVFIDLFRKTEQIKRQREALARYAAQLQQLSRASLAISAARSVEDVVEITTVQAARIIGAHQALAAAAVADGRSRVTTRHVSSRHADADGGRTSTRRAEGTPRHVASPVRMDADALSRAFEGASLPRTLIDDLPMRGWLAAPLITRDGDSIGTLELSEKDAGEFTAEDEDICVQLAQMASVAIDNILAVEAREANRLKDEFLSVLSHELRTPLQAILTWIAILRRDALDAATTTRALDVIERSARAQTQLIEDLLDVSRIIRGQLRLELGVVQMPRVLELAVEALKPAAAAKSIRIDVDAPDGPCEIVGDASRLQQVILNLVSNAVKFTPDRGMVQLALTPHPNCVEIRVRDSGPGIPADFLPYVFERFRQADSTTRRRHGGLGLGLAIVRSLVELHGGEVMAENAADSGACFTVVLPRGSVAAHEPVHESAEARIEHAHNGELHGGGTRLDGISVVLVEDEAEARESLAAALELSGATVRAVGSADEALAELSRNGARNGGPHVLLSDIGLPHVDGYELIRRVRAHEALSGERIPAAALTAYVRAEDRATALRAGFDAHVKKPVEPERLARVVRRLADQHARR